MNYSQIINDKMNADIKKRYANILASEYQIVRESEAKIIDMGAARKKQSILKIVAATMVLVLLACGFYFLTKKTAEDPKVMTKQYLSLIHI